MAARDLNLDTSFIRSQRQKIGQNWHNPGLPIRGGSIFRSQERKTDLLFALGHRYIKSSFSTYIWLRLPMSCLYYQQNNSSAI